MSDDEAEPELLELLRKSLGISSAQSTISEDTRVLEGAQYVCDNSIDVAIDPRNTKKAANQIWELMQQKEYSTKTWSTHELHPKLKDESTVDFIFSMDLLNFCFWSDRPSHERFAVEYKGKRWTGYWSLVAALQRALEESKELQSYINAPYQMLIEQIDIPITTPDFWHNEDECTKELLKHVFRSATEEEIPLLHERMLCLREAGAILHEKFGSRFSNCIHDAKGSAAALVNILVENFPAFRDEVKFEGRLVRFYKRAQILVADLWACFEEQDYGEFHDIDKITMFADYRIPQMLHSLGCLLYSPPLEHHIRQMRVIEPGHSWEIQLRGCSIWCVEMIGREIQKLHPDARVNAILIDFFLYDTMKEQESSGQEEIPHHRTRSIWY